MSDWIEGGTRRWSRMAGGLHVRIEMDYGKGEASWTVDQSGRCVASGMVSGSPDAPTVTWDSGPLECTKAAGWQPHGVVGIEALARWHAGQAAAAIAEIASDAWQRMRWREGPRREIGPVPDPCVGDVVVMCLADGAEDVVTWNGTEWQSVAGDDGYDHDYEPACWSWLERGSRHDN